MLLSHIMSRYDATRWRRGECPRDENYLRLCCCCIANNNKPHRPAAPHRTFCELTKNNTRRSAFILSSCVLCRACASITQFCGQRDASWANIYHHHIYGVQNRVRTKRKCARLCGKTHRQTESNCTHILVCMYVIIIIISSSSFKCAA